MASNATNGEPTSEKEKRETMALKNQQSKSKSWSSIGEYLVGEKIGEGSFGKVFAAYHYISNKKVAIKLIEVKTPRTKVKLQRETEIMKLLIHPNIVHLYEVITIPERNTTCLIMEYVSGGELFDYIVQRGKLDEAEAIHFFRHMVSALEYCHSNFVIHRDLKPENILLDSKKNVKIMDFGLSNIMTGSSFLQTNCGSPIYTAPEVLQSRGYIGPEVDVWSMGCLVYVMVTGCCPWNGKNIQEQIQLAIKGKYELFEGISDECWHLISRMLTVDPKKRATLAEVRTHPWVMRGHTEPPLSCLPPQRDPPGKLDSEILKQLTALGFEKEEVVADVLANRKVKQTYVMYYLMADHKEKSMKAKHQAITRHASNKKLEGQMKLAQQQANNEAVQGLADTAIKLRQSAPITNTVPDIVVSDQQTDSQHGVGGIFSKLKKKLAADGQQKNAATLRVGSLHRRQKSGSDFFASSNDLNGKEPRPEVKKLSTSMGNDLRIPLDESISGSSISTSSPRKSIKVDKLRTIKEIPSGEKVSGKSTEEIESEIEIVLNTMRVTYKKKGHKYVCKKFALYDKLKIEMEVVKIEKEQELRGIKFKRAAGNVWDYKDALETLGRELKL